MRLYFLALFLFLYACSSPAGKTAAPTTTDKQAQSGTADSTVMNNNDPPHGQTPAQVTNADSQIMAGSTLSIAEPNITIPPYNLGKIQTAIGNLQSVEDSSDGNITVALSATIYASYSLREKFTYNMIHAEDYSQMCDILPEHTNEKGRIYGQLPEIFGEYDWSERQRDFFSTHKDSVEQLMKSVIDEKGRVGMNFLHVIVSIKARKMIPFLIDTYHKDNSNHYILTALMLLMKNDQYPEFRKSSSYNKLYDLKTDTYSAFIVYNKANEDLIIKRATDFCNDSSQHF